MGIFGRHSLRSTVALSIIMLVFLSPLVAGHVARAHQPETILVRAILSTTSATSSWLLPSPDPSGIAYWAARDQLLIVDGEVDEMSIFADANIFVSSRAGTLLRAGTSIPWSSEPVGIAIHPLTGHFFISDDDTKAIFEVDIGSDMQLGTDDDVVHSLTTTVYGNNDPEGLTFDSAGTLYLTNGEEAKVHRITAGANGVFDGPAPTGDDLVSSWGTAALGQPDPEGIAYHNGLLYIISNAEKATIAEVTLDGSLERTINLGNVLAMSAADLTWAPASTGSYDDHIYLVARGIDNDWDPAENDGRLYEIIIPGTSRTIHLPLVITGRQN